LPAFLGAFRHRNYRLFFGGQIISLTGTWMQSVAEAWLVYRLTGSATLLGATSFATLIPVFVFATVGGTVADRVNRHHLLVVTQSLSMIGPLVLAALTLTGRVQVWHVFALATCLGIVNAFDIPGRQAFLVDMVGREDLTNAIALNSSMVNGARVVGPAVAGLLVAAIGEGWCFLLNGLSYLAVIGGLLMMRVSKPPARQRRAALREAADGFRFVLNTAPVRALLMLLGIISCAGMPYSVLMPVFAEKVLHGGARGLGILMAAAGLGALGGALALVARSGVRGLGKWVAVSGAAFGVSLIAFSLSRQFWLSAVLLLPVGASMIVQMAASNTLIQAMVPDALRGRVMALYSMMFMGMAPFGSLFAGWLAERITAPATVALGGVVCIGAAGVFSARLPSLRGEARQLIVAQELAGGTPAAEKTGGSDEVPLGPVKSPAGPPDARGPGAPAPPAY
jgi:MFS family permease